MSHEAIYRQPEPGNLQEKKTFTLECLHIILVDRKTLSEKLLKCYQSCPVAGTAVGSAKLLATVASCDKALMDMTEASILDKGFAAMFQAWLATEYASSPVNSYKAFYKMDNIKQTGSFQSQNHL